MVDRPSDESLAKLAKEGDVASFEELFGRYKKPILNFIYRFIGNLQTAEEVAIEVFMKAYANLKIFDPDKKFSTWIYTIARNLSKNALRDRRYFRNVSLEEPVNNDDGSITLGDVVPDKGASPDMLAVDAELAKEAQKILNSMPVKYKEVITLCCVQELSYKEAADIIGISIASVSIRIKEAKKIFMQKLGELT